MSLTLTTPNSRTQLAQAPAPTPHANANDIGHSAHILTPTYSRHTYKTYNRHIPSPPRVPWTGLELETWDFGWLGFGTLVGLLYIAGYVLPCTRAAVGGFFVSLVLLLSVSASVPVLSVRYLLLTTDTELYWLAYWLDIHWFLGFWVYF